MKTLKNSRPTMREVAALSGTSLKTVSRVFNEVSTVDPELVVRVKKAAAKLHYTPNMTAGSLRRIDGRTRTIGLLLVDISNPFSSVLHRVFENYARELGFIVFVASLDEEADREKELVSLFISRRVDGLIIAPSTSDHSYLKPEVKAGIKVGFIDRPPINFAADSVLSTNKEGSKDAVDHLLSFGHKRIAYIGDQPDIYTAQQRYSGYKSALQSAKIPLNQSMVIQGPRSHEDLIDQIKKLVTSSNAPTAIFASQNLVTVAAIRALRDARLEKKVALIGFDEIPVGDLLDPAITLVTQDIRAMGEKSAELLFSRINGYDGKVRQEIIPTTLTARGSGEIRPKF